MTMRLLKGFDDTDTTKLPTIADVFAGYVNGRYANFTTLRRTHPGAKYYLSIDVNGSRPDADVLDIEAGDAKVTYAPVWFGNWHKQAAVPMVPKPIFYTSASDVSALNAVMARAGISRDRYYVWSAHYTGTEHICGAGCGFPTADMTQWTDKALGRSLDESLIHDYVFEVVPVSTPNITAAIAAADAYAAALAKINNAPGVNRRVKRMLKTVATQRAYLVSKDVK